MTDFEDYTRPVVVHRDNGMGGVAEAFIISLYEEAERLTPLLESEEEMNLTPQQEAAHEATTSCWLCLEPFEEDNKKRKKCRDHCHYTYAYFIITYFIFAYFRKLE